MPFIAFSITLGGRGKRADADPVDNKNRMWTTMSNIDWVEGEYDSH